MAPAESASPGRAWKHAVVTTPVFHPRRWLAAAIVASLGLAALLVVVVPAGQPYDEPSHWSTAQFYADNHRIPVLGDPGITYEAQQGPVAYSLLALVVSPLSSGFSDQAGFLGGRLLEGLLLVGVVLLTYDLARQLCPSRPRLAVGSAALMGVTPTVVAYSASIQNDSTVLVLATAAACVAVRLLAPGDTQRSSRTWVMWLVVGVLMGLAVLSKVQAVSLLPALVIAAGSATPSERRPELLKGAALAVAGFAATAGWWFLRNHRLYGDLLATQKGNELTGISNQARPFNPHELAELARGVVSVAWAPTEYYRNAFKAPAPVRALALLFTVAVVGGAIAGLWQLRHGRPSKAGDLIADIRVRPDVAFSGVWVVLTIAMWLWIVFTSSSLGPRVLTVVGAPVVLGTGVALSGLRATRRWRVYPAALGLSAIAFAVAVDLWMAYEVVKLAPAVYWIADVGWPALGST